MKCKSRGFAPPKVTECSFILKLLFLIMCMYVYLCVVGMSASMQVNEEARGIVSPLKWVLKEHPRSPVLNC